MTNEVGKASAIQVLLYESKTGVTAVCLERYLVAVGHDRGAAIREFDRVFHALVDLNVSEGKDPFADLPVTPHRFLTMAEGARRLTESEVAEVRNAPLQSLPFDPAYIQRMVA